jgi:hypothetical protein
MDGRRYDPYADGVFRDEMAMTWKVVDRECGFGVVPDADMDAGPMIRVGVVAVDEPHTAEPVYVYLSLPHDDAVTLLIGVMEAYLERRREQTLRPQAE